MPSRISRTRTVRILASLLLTVALCLAQIGNSGLTKTVTTSGTAVQLSSTSILVRSFIVTGLAANTGAIWLGGSNVLAASKNGTPLSASQSVGYLPVGENVSRNYYDLSKFWMDAAVSGEGVSVSYAK